MYVNIPSHVYATPKNEYWYDEVMVKPVDTTKDLYYQVYDTTSLWGNNYLTDMPKPVSTQKYGMDFMWNTTMYMMTITEIVTTISLTVPQTHLT